VLYHDPAPVGGVAVGLLLGTQGLFGLSVNIPLLLLGFCGTALAYAVDRMWADAPEDRANRPARVAWVNAHRGWLALETSLFVAAAGATLPYLRWPTLLGTALLGGLAVLHVGPRDQDALLVQGGLRKPITIAGAWAIGGTVLPILEAGQAVDLGVLLFAGYRFFFILPNVLLADWADRGGDAHAGLAPWATAWSIRQVRQAATGGLLVALGGAALWGLLGDSPLLVALDAVGLLLMLGMVWRSDPARPRDAFLADLVVAWPLVPALWAGMIV